MYKLQNKEAYFIPNFSRINVTEDVMSIEFNKH